MTSLKTKVLHGLGWSMGARIFNQSSSFVITAILARLLSPGDFGLVGMVTVFTGFATIFAELGISAALIQNQNVDDRHYSSAFLLNVISGGLLTLLIISVSPFLAAFYDKPQLKPLIFALSFNFIISSFGVVHKAVLTKKLDFKKLTLIESISTVCGGVTGIVMAFQGFGTWSLIFQMLTYTFSNTLLLWTVSPFHIKFIFSIDAIKDIFSFSANLTGFNIVNYFARNIDYLLIGKFLGAEALGYYTLAYKIMLYPLRNVSQVIGRVIYPALSQIKDDVEKIRFNYLKMIKAISLVTYPMMLSLFALAPEFINLVFGDNWVPVIKLTQILCFSGMIQSVSVMAGSLRLSQGRADLQLKLGIINTILIIVFVVMGMRWGIYGVAIFYTLYSFIWFIYANHISLSLIDVSLKDFVQIQRIPLFIGFIQLSLLNFIRFIITIDNIITLVLTIVLGIIIYLSLLFFTKQITITHKKIEFVGL